MTREEWCRARGIEAAHPEDWGEGDRDAYLVWRLAEHARLERRLATREQRRTVFRTLLRESVQRILDERRLGALYQRRYRACRCPRCKPPDVSAAELAAYLAQHPEARTVSPQTQQSLAVIHRFKGTIFGEVIETEGRA